MAAASARGKEGSCRTVYRQTQAGTADYRHATTTRTHARTHAAKTKTVSLYAKGERPLLHVDPPAENMVCAPAGLS